jgi:HAD superfamily hydrolase (TIGR01509 family)
MVGTVTFDFHNTLAVCDAWFELEVRGLAAAYLSWRAARDGAVVSPELTAAANAAYRRLRVAIIDHGNELPAEECVAEVLAGLAEPVEPPLIAAGVADLMRASLAGVAPVRGAVETVRALAAAGLRLGVVSSAVYHPFLEWTLERFGVRDAFHDVTTSASAGYYKSRPEIYWHAVAALGGDPQRAVHVGDSYRFDVGGARRAGLRTVWLRAPDAAPPDGPPPDLTVGSLEGAAPGILALLDGRPGGTV